MKYQTVHATIVSVCLLPAPQGSVNLLSCLPANMEKKRGCTLLLIGSGMKCVKLLESMMMVYQYNKNIEPQTTTSKRVLCGTPPRKLGLVQPLPGKASIL